MNKLSLGTRLFLSHLIVMIVGLGSFVAIAKISSPQFFVLRLEQLEKRGFLTVRSAKTYLIDGFQTAWNTSTYWSIIVGGSTAGVASYWLTKRIMKPLKIMKEITKNFAEGDLEKRMPNSEILELHQLSVSFNLMASSLKDVEKRRRELVSDLTHELRTPLTVVIGYLEELASGDIEPSTQLYLSLIKETKRLERLTRDLQELSKAEAGYLSINLQPVKLQPLLQSLVEKFTDQLLDEGPTLELNYLSELPLVLADLDRCEQILVNLIGNAVRYTEQGKITITAWQENKKVLISIEDTGVGIAQEDLPHIFERFWRADRSRSSYSGGSGIGLAIVNQLVILQQGEITVKSELGKGSNFTFSIPTA